VLVGEDDGLDAVAHVELLQEVPDVRLDRGQRDHQLLGDLAVGEAAAHELEHLELAASLGAGQVVVQIGIVAATALLWLATTARLGRPLRS
jgi:hypothetical protein